jgi:hypothetical protein
MMRWGALSMTTTRPRSSVKLKGDEACDVVAFCAIDIDGNIPTHKAMQVAANFQEWLIAKHISIDLSAQAPNANR